MTVPTIQTAGLTKGYGDICALKPLDLQVAEGEWLSVMGHSGSGKSTLMNLVGGLDRPSGGSLSVGGQDLSALSEDGLARFRREFVGIIFQQHHLVPYLSAVENVMLSQYFHSVPDEAEARLALERVGLGHRLKNRPGELSGGEQQRVCIARAIINSPKLLLGDEPTGNLDHKSTVMVLELLKELRAEDRFTVVLVTHNEEVAAWGDRTIYLDDGVLVREERLRS
ncbi:ABC transporter ATP-binding protein [Geomesophilobacter sediminis]|uniref:ABC transporter ATP-binding protein n=1 Tax=Geomesophilobacter sediminis TaxID=2798584 RepID=A0A8J7M253_9BACT|nr:ABC transporter ATP-binding protein [Geomesophilobacter sediminis]MBJ6727287.1 ABC transporter ATP-binding protein [Geomesophilobacter sediminis]